MKNSSIAAIEGNIAVEAENELEVSSIGQTTAEIYANASATQAKTGIGAAVALNIVSYINEAYIDQAAIKAGTLKVLAQMPEKESKEDKGTEDEETEDEWVKNLVTGLVTEAADKMGLKDLIGEENTEKLTRLLAGTADQVVTVAKTTMLKGTPLEGMKLEDIRNNPENLLKFRELIGSNITETLKTNAKPHLMDSLPGWM